MNYDYLIVGGGPNGLTLAWYLSQYKYKVCLIEKEDNLGGCHSVKRQDGLFSEHGPRFYLGNYNTFQNLLRDMKLDFYDIFTPYKFYTAEIVSAIKIIFDKMSIREMFYLFVSFLNLNESQRHVSFENYLKEYNFSQKSIDFLNNLCKLTDGAGVDKYTLYNFLQIINQNIFYKIYQPKQPNDIGLFSLWKDKLIKNNVDIRLNTSAMDVETENNKITSIICETKLATGKNNNNKTKIYGKNIIFALPPYTLANIMSKSSNSLFKNSFGNINMFKTWTDETNYIIYIPMTFHWNKKIDIKEPWDYNLTDWNVAKITLSDYMNFNDKRSITVISVCISNNAKSSFTKKTPNETNDKEELIRETFRQLKITYPNLPNPTYVVMADNYHDGNKWVSNNTAFMTTVHGYIDPKSKNISNLYSCGMHNGKSEYGFTSLEGATVNAVGLVHDLVPTSKNEIKIETMIKVTSIIIIILILMIIFIVVLHYIQ